jgi:hypothetical protein
MITVGQVSGLIAAAVHFRKAPHTQCSQARLSNLWSTTVHFTIPVAIVVILVGHIGNENSAATW